MSKFKFSVGPWNVHSGADSYGPAVRDEIPFEEKIKKFKDMGFDADGNGKLQIRPLGHFLQGKAVDEPQLPDTGGDLLYFEIHSGHGLFHNAPQTIYNTLRNSNSPSQRQIP